MEGIMGQLIQRGICRPHKFADTMVHQGVHAWTFSCRYPYNSCAYRKTVGPIRYDQTSRRELSEFGAGLLDFILDHISDGIDHSRMHRLRDRTTLISERVVFIGDSVAASLASRTRDRYSAYVELYTIKELAKFLNTAYFGCDVQQVVLAVGRTDMPRLRVNKGAGELRFYTEHILIALARNFPHVRFTFVMPPYTHTQRSQWEEQVLVYCADALEIFKEDLRQVRCVPALPRLYRTLYDRCSNDFDDAQDWMDCEGNLRWNGLVNLIRHLHANLRVEVFQLDPKADGVPLFPRRWEVQELTRGPPAEQQNPPVGKADLLYLSEEELPARRFSMRPPVDSDSQRSTSQTDARSPSPQEADEPAKGSLTAPEARFSNVRDAPPSHPSVTTDSGSSTPATPGLGGKPYHAPQYQLVPQTQATNPTGQGQTIPTLSAGFTTAQPSGYIPSPLQLYGQGYSYGQATYYPSPLHQQTGVSQTQPQRQALQPTLTVRQSALVPPPATTIPPPPGMGHLFRPPVTDSQWLTSQMYGETSGQPMAPQTQMFGGNQGQPMAPQAQTVGVYGAGAGYSGFQVHPSQFSQVHAHQSHQQQSQTPGSDGYHSLPTSAPASSTQTPAPQQQQPPAPTAPMVGQNVTLTSDMVDALLKAGFTFPPRQ